MASNNDNNNLDAAALNNDNDNNADGGGGEDIINHDRLRSISNYYFESMVSLPEHAIAYRRARLADPSCAEELREEARQERYKMVSWMEDEDRLEGTGLNLDWGEYYIADDEMESDDDDESDVSSCEEAEEINDEELQREDMEALSSLTSVVQFNNMNFDQLDNEVDAPSNASLMGMPDIILEKILQYPDLSEICTLERVCKRIRRMTTDDQFWARHPSSACFVSWLFQSGIQGKLDESHGWSPNPINSYLDDRIKKCKKSSGRALTRKLAFEIKGLRWIARYQKNETNAIVNVLGEADPECVADTLRNVSADILSRMNHLGPEAHFRLRGDTLGYLFILLQGYMIERLRVALLVAVNKHSVEPSANPSRVHDMFEVQRDDIVMAFQRDLFCPFLFHSRKPTRCNVSNGFHGHVASVLDCSCSISSSSGISWRWPLDNCHEVLPPEAGRRMIRRMAYQAGIMEMSSEAFVLAEAELLHAMGVLLVDSYESSVEIVENVPFFEAEEQAFLGSDEELTYNTPTDSVDMFKSPPPPFYPPGYKWYLPGDREDVRKESIYTVVPGQIRSAAEKRDITPSHVYGAKWIATSGFTVEEEIEIERSYYYEKYCEDGPDGISDDIKESGGYDDLGGYVYAREEVYDGDSDDRTGSEDEEDAVNPSDEDVAEDSEISWDEFEDMNLDMDDYSGMGDSIEPYQSESLQDEDEDVVDPGMEIDNNIEEFMA